MIGNKLRQGLKPAHSFPAGHKPWNKDLKGIHLSPGSEFIRGQDAHNKCPVGTVTIRRRARNDELRAYVKVAEPSTWKLRAVLVWEKANGPLPVGKLVHHKDRDSLNDALNNLEALTRREHIAEHRGDLLAAKGLQAYAPAVAPIAPPGFGAAVNGPLFARAGGTK